MGKCSREGCDKEATIKDKDTGDPFCSRECLIEAFEIVDSKVEVETIHYCTNCGEKVTNCSHCGEELPANIVCDPLGTGEHYCRGKGCFDAKWIEEIPKGGK